MMLGNSARRRFLRGLVGVATAGVGLPTLANTPPATRFHNLLASRGINSRELWLVRPESKDEARLSYASGTTLLRDGYLQACWMLRDIQINQMHPIDPQILEILGAIQAWLAIYGFRLPIHILSGFRSLQTNSRTEGAAKNSLHLLGRAVDIRMPGVPKELLLQLVRELSEGGLGIYLSSNFLHIDIGRGRSWVVR